MKNTQNLSSTGEDPKKWNLFLKKVVYSYTFKLQSPSKYSPIDAIHLSTFFFHCSNSFWTWRFWCLLVLLPVFISPLPRQQSISPWGVFSSGKTKKNVAQGQKKWIGRVGNRALALFGQKLLNTQHGVGRCALNHPSWNGHTRWIFKKKVTKTEHSLSQQRQPVHWNRWVPTTPT